MKSFSHQFQPGVVLNQNDLMNICRQYPCTVDMTNCNIVHKMERIFLKHYKVKCMTDYSKKDRDIIYKIITEEALKRPREEDDEKLSRRKERKRLHIINDYFDKKTAALGEDYCDLDKNRNYLNENFEDDLETGENEETNEDVQDLVDDRNDEVEASFAARRESLVEENFRNSAINEYEELNSESTEVYDDGLDDLLQISIPAEENQPDTENVINESYRFDSSQSESLIINMDMPQSTESPLRINNGNVTIRNSQKSVHFASQNMVATYRPENLAHEFEINTESEEFPAEESENYQDFRTANLVTSTQSAYGDV